MHVHIGAVVAGLIAIASPALADSVAVTSGPNGTTIINGKPCRVVTGKSGSNGTNSTTITAGGGQVSGSTTVSPGGSGSSVVVGSGSSGGSSSSAGSTDCVIHRRGK